MGRPHAKPEMVCVTTDWKKMCIRDSYGDIHGDHIIKCAPDWEGVVDEDDQPIQVSCC